MRQGLSVWIKRCILAVAVFAMGSVAGAMLDGFYRARASATTPSIKDGEAYLQVLDGDLHLTDKQASDVRLILNQTRDQYSSLCAEVKPRYNALRDDSRQKIRMLLTSDQQDKFDAMVTQENCNCPDPKLR